MKQADLVGKAQTVLGPVDPESLGITLPHEHLLCDVSTYFAEPDDPSKKAQAYQPLSLENLSWVGFNYFTNRDNLLFNDKNLAIKEAMMYKNAGGNTIVELSNIGLGRDPQGLVDIARATGLNIIMGCGYYVSTTHPPELAAKTVEAIAEEMIRDITVGVGDTGVRSGIIGEIGCSAPLDAAERKVLQAAAIAQQRTGAAINVHPSPFDDETALEIVRILDDAGADLNRVVISHIDQWCYSLSTIHQIADAGCYIEYDSFGFPANPEYNFGKWRDMTSDAQRINDVIQLIKDGYLNRLLLSSDHCMKIRLAAYGGRGYAHILENILRVMRAKGVTEEQIHTMLVDNPKRILQFAPARG